MATDTSRAHVAAKAGWYGVLALLAALVLFPLYLTFVRALSDPGRYAASDSPLHPVDTTWNSFADAFHIGGLGTAFAVSVLVCVLTVIAQFVTSTLAAYAFVFLNFPFKRLLFTICIASLMLPMEVTLLANVSTIHTLNWVSSYQGLVLPYAATGFGIFLLRQGFTGIPQEVRDAAQLDGHGHLRFLLRFAIPLTRPVVASFVLISALTAWGNYLWPRLVTVDEAHRTLPLALADLARSGPQHSNVSTAGVLLAIAPIWILLVVFQRQMVAGLTAGAVKG